MTTTDGGGKISRRVAMTAQLDRVDSKARPLASARLGPIGYADGLDLQRALHSRVADGEMDGALLLLEHPHVYTLGRRGTLDDILTPTDRLASLGAEVHHVDRGGEVTYHGPGQLVGYPVVSLRRLRLRPLEYVRSLERLLIDTLSGYGVAAEAEGHPTGVWTGGAKIAAIGVRVSRGVTTHGFALNVSPDLGYFEHIVPCGMRDCQVTSMASEGASADVDEVASELAGHFEQVFDVRLEPMSGVSESVIAHRILRDGSP